MGNVAEATDPPRAPKRPAATTTSAAARAAGNERMERLRRFQEERARKRAEARAKAPKAPFYVGVYKVGTGNESFTDQHWVVAVVPTCKPVRVQPHVGSEEFFLETWMARRMFS